MPTRATRVARDRAARVVYREKIYLSSLGSQVQRGDCHVAGTTDFALFQHFLDSTLDRFVIVGNCIYGKGGGG